MNNYEQLVRKHAEEESPKEACGLLLRSKKKGEIETKACRNVSKDPLRHFEIPDEDLAQERAQDVIVGIYHSHTTAPAVFSEDDIQMSEVTGYPYLVYSLLDGKFNMYRPKGNRSNLIGRKFSFGIFDCATLVIDYYLEKLGIVMPYFEHDLASMLNGHRGFKAYLKDLGFFEIYDWQNPMAHDIILMSTNGMGIANHAGVFTENRELLHQLINRDSAASAYFGTVWQKQTVGMFRHSGL